MYQTNAVENIKKTHSMFNKSPPRKSCRSWVNVQKYGTARQVADGNLMDGECALHAGYLRQEHTLRITNTYCFSRTRTRFSVTLYVQCLCVKVLHGDNKITNPSPQFTTPDPRHNPSIRTSSDTAPYQTICGAQCFTVACGLMRADFENTQRQLCLYCER